MKSMRKELESSLIHTASITALAVHEYMKQLLLCMYSDSMVKISRSEFRDRRVSVSSDMDSRQSRLSSYNNPTFVMLYHILLRRGRVGGQKTSEGQTVGMLVYLVDGNVAVVLATTKPRPKLFQSKLLELME